MTVKSGIYIMTNPSFPEYVKIGYADNIDRRLDDFNRTSVTPFAFRLYAYYEVSHRLDDLKIHSMIDMINPNLRSVDNLNGRKRVREFYCMSAEDAYMMFEAIAQINGLENNLHLCKQTEVEEKQENDAQEIKKNSERRSRFNFGELGIKPGSVLTYIDDSSITCEVVDNIHVSYKGEVMSVSALTSQIRGGKGQYNGALFFLYNGKTISDIRTDFESSN